LSNIKLEIYDLLGRKVRTLTKVQFSAGSHEIEWNGLDDNGKSVGSGIYIFVLSDGALSISKKMIKLE
jgi:flagellar hook assembly protein FlgD